MRWWETVGSGGGETVVGMYHVTEESIFYKNKKETPSNSYQYFCSDIGKSAYHILTEREYVKGVLFTNFVSYINNQFFPDFSKTLNFHQFKGY